MQAIDSIKTPHVISIGISPNEGDIAIVSIDNESTPGTLNRMVLKEYGYSELDFPKKEYLRNSGFTTLTDDVKKPILFVVTVVDGTKTRENLEINLYNTLSEFRGWFLGKKLWIPLMGTGTGGLSLDESFSITVSAINKFQNEYPTETTILLSIPNEPKGIEFLTNRKYLTENSNDTVETFLNSFNGRFYLVGSTWDNEDQTTRFYEQNIWESGYTDDRYLSIINRIKKGDILIIKSTFSKGKVSYLRIKGLGIVMAPSENGVTLNVNWRVQSTNFDIEGLGFYRETIHMATQKDLRIILPRLGPIQWQRDFSALSAKSLRKETIADLISDSDTGHDFLNITKDVNAFSRVVAAKSFTPPLAIALFGKWGSGKSFFMRKMKEQITRLSTTTTGTYCEGIVQIHFNAWSYVDSNLWASLVTKIFEELSEYISENRKSEVNKKDIEKELSRKLSITKDEISALASKKNAVSDQINSLKNRRSIINKEIEKKIRKLKTDTLSRIIGKVNTKYDASTRILQSLNENDSYFKSESELKAIIPKEYWSDPEKTYHIIKSNYTLIKEFFSPKLVFKNLIWLAFIISLIIFCPIILAWLLHKINITNFEIPRTTTSLLIICVSIWKRAEAIYSDLQPTIASFWKIKVDYEQQVDEATAQFEQEEKGLNLEIEKEKSELLLVDQQIQITQTIKADLEFRISNSLATETLYSFIDKRSKSDDYRKHLGIVSTIRRDFEVLNDLFIGHNQEIDENREILEFRNKFKKPLERIILYVDDLDRCPEDNVVQVLEAVNLLMAFPLFVVIVGVDSRWVKNALIKKHNEQFSKEINSGYLLDGQVDKVDPSSYLEKIFQVPFHLKDAKDNNVKDMIRSLSDNKVELSEFIPKLNNDIPKGSFRLNSALKATTSKSTFDLDQLVNAKQNLIIEEKPEVLKLSESEIEAMQDMSDFIGTNPRTIKRFVNIYRIIKAHDEFEYESDSTNKDLLAILFMLALSLGNYKKLLPSLEIFIQKNSNNRLEFYLSSEYTINEELDLLKNRLRIILTDHKFKVLQNIVGNTFSKYNTFVRRFTFMEV